LIPIVIPIDGKSGRMAAGESTITDDCAATT